MATPGIPGTGIERRWKAAGGWVCWVSEVTLGKTGPSFAEVPAGLTCLHLLLFPEQTNPPGASPRAWEVSSASRWEGEITIRSHFKYRGW